ncbi:nitronate monooxygenase [Kribbella qitaiheensis]|uniref:nitronate monooxygenase n=1 Tax=Kribbella qitaiheensis TaxID=1544730 RepID=UPI001FE4A2BD|nr:nitronate monooxygenase [Kribbella qitaiheensis]
MANVSGGRLTAAISAAGGLGMLGAGSMVSADWIRTEGAVAAAGGKPYGIGLMAWSVADHPEHLEAVIELRPAFVSLSFGDLTPYVEPLQAAGIVVAMQAGTVADAREGIAAGVDAIVARGAEAGGHGRNVVGTLPLLQAILDLTDLPVLAAGGISGARGLAAVLAGRRGRWLDRYCVPHGRGGADARDVTAGLARSRRDRHRLRNGFRRRLPSRLAGRVRRPRSPQRLLRSLGRPGAGPQVRRRRPRRICRRNASRRPHRRVPVRRPGSRCPDRDDHRRCGPGRPRHLPHLPTKRYQPPLTSTHSTRTRCLRWHPSAGTCACPERQVMGAAGSGSTLSQGEAGRIWRPLPVARDTGEAVLAARKPLSVYASLFPVSGATSGAPLVGEPPAPRLPQPCHGTPVLKRFPELRLGRYR